MPIYSCYYNIIHLLALLVHQIVSMVEDPNTKVKPREWSFADTLLKLFNAVQLSKTEAMNQIQNNRVLKVALAAAEHIFDDAKSKKSLPPREMLPYFVLTKQDLPAAHAKSFTLNAFRQDLSLVEHMSIDVISQLVAENQGLISKTDFRLLHPLAPAIQKQLLLKNSSANSKTDPKYLGPFIIHHCTNNGAYVLQDITGDILPDKVPPSALKLVDPNTPFEDKHFEVEKVLDHDGPPSNRYYLVKWKGYPDSDNSWAAAKDFSSQRPITTYWGKKYPKTKKRRKRR
ncbi:Chromo domain-containing protein [Balamuthia mandrillaris]